MMDVFTGLCAVVSFSSLILLTTKLMAVFHTSRSQKATPCGGTINSFVRCVWKKSSTRNTNHQMPLLTSLPARLSTNPCLLKDEKYLPPSSSPNSSALESHIHSFAQTRPRSTYLGRSTFECPRFPSLYGRHKHLSETAYLGLICRLNPSTGRTTVRVHPEDAKLILQAAWGVHANGNEVTLHAARNEEEVEIVKQITQAALGWVCGDNVEEGEDVDEDVNFPRPMWLLA